MISFGNLKERKICSRNKIIKPLTINCFVINIYKVYMISRQTIIKTILYFLLLNVCDFDNLVTKSIEIFCYGFFEIKNIVSSL